MAEKKNLQLLVRNRDEVLFEGEVESVTSHNDVGVFDVLERHANFISLVNDVLDLVLPGGEKRQIRVGNGVLRVRSGVVEVYLGIRRSERPGVSGEQRAS